MRRDRRREQLAARGCRPGQLHRRARAETRPGSQHPRALRPYPGRRTPQAALRNPVRPLVEGRIPARKRRHERLDLRREGRRHAHRGARPGRRTGDPLRKDLPPRAPHAGTYAGPRRLLRRGVEVALHGRHALPRVDRPHGPARRRLLVDHALDPRRARPAGRRGARLPGPRNRIDHRPRGALQPLHRRGAQRGGKLQRLPRPP